MNEERGICPKCGKPCDVETIEVDIGVGVQVHRVGWWCDACGGVGACNGCGVALLDGADHPAWCEADR